MKQSEERTERNGVDPLSSGYRPVEYDCGDGVKIRLCPEFVSCIGNKPEYWYIAKPITDDMRFRSMWGSAFRLLYWHESGDWSHCKPKQFPTAKDAINFHKEFLSDNASDVTR